METNNTETDYKLSYIKKFADDSKHPFDELDWEPRSVKITDDTGKIIFQQDDVEVPVSWSDLAVKVVVSKYFYGKVGTDERETSIKQLISRVADTIGTWTLNDGFFDTPISNDNYRMDLLWLLVNQYGAFNSPVWFNVGVYETYNAGKDSNRGNWYWDVKAKKANRSKNQYEYPQGSACFIQSVEDNMESIMHLAYTEAMLFKFGSGTGTDLSTIRSSKENLNGGGKPSGPMSFLKIYDQVANVVKSGGKTRRAAKMNTLNTWHGDIDEFITAKEHEERKAHALIEQGYDGNFNGPAYGSIAYQNENLSVRADDQFMSKAIGGVDSKYYTKAVTSGEELEEVDASDLMDKIASGTWFCGDPGMQFSTTINDWHTCSGTAPINSSNPCAEYLFLDNTACNLASLNLLKFTGKDQEFDSEKFSQACKVFIIAQEALVDNASYPSELIAENSHIFRTLGLGYANLGALLMSQGLPYDSDKGRELTSCITAIMTGSAYLTSVQLSRVFGAFPGYENSYASGVKKTIRKDNVGSMQRVIDKHIAAVHAIETDSFKSLKSSAQALWSEVKDLGNIHGFRNAQVTVIAPTGTIAFLMDCDTTGIEPDIALVKYKLLAGGGTLKIVNQRVEKALTSLSYTPYAILQIKRHIEKYDTIEDLVDGGKIIKSGLNIVDLPVFDCAFKAEKGVRSIRPNAHLEAMAAAQPFISGAISKTVNMPETCTRDDIRKAYVKAWKLGLKCIAIYRDGSKKSQPLNTKKVGKTTQEVTVVPKRKRLKDTREAVNHKFTVGNHEGYLTVGLFEDGSPGELFITMAKEGSTVGGLMDTIGTLTSMSLQYGVPIEVLVNKFSYQRFEPSGFTSNPDIKRAASIIDYVFRWLGNRYIDTPKKSEKSAETTETVETVGILPDPVGEVAPVSSPSKFRDGETCANCGSSDVQKTGSCATCLNCGTSLGCS